MRLQYQGGSGHMEDFYKVFYRLLYQTVIFYAYIILVMYNYIMII